MSTRKDAYHAGLCVRWFNKANDELARCAVTDGTDGATQLVAMIIDSGAPLEIGDYFRFEETADKED
jgi:hypothetical protein